MILPGQLYAWYRWGETVSSIAPAISKRPVLVRDVLRYADPRASQLLATVDDLVQQARLVPGQLLPLLRLMAVGQVLVPTDGRPDQSGETDPATVAAALGDTTFAPGRAAQTYGRSRTFLPAVGRGGAAARLPDLRRYPLPGPGPGIIRLQSQQNSTVLDGDADGIAELAAVGMLDPEPRAVLRGGSRPAVADRVRHGAALVFSDANRRRVVSGVRVAQDQGPTLGAQDPIEQSLPSYDLFSRRGTPDQTVAAYDGLKYARSPESISLTLAAVPAVRGLRRATGHHLAGQYRRSPRRAAQRRPHPSARRRVHPRASAQRRFGYRARTATPSTAAASAPSRGDPAGTRCRSRRAATLACARRMNTPFSGAGGLDEVQIRGCACARSCGCRRAWPTRPVDSTCVATPLRSSSRARPPTSRIAPATTSPTRSASRRPKPSTLSRASAASSACRYAGRSGSAAGGASPRVRPTT